MPASATQSPSRQKLPHGLPPWVGKGAIFFITISCADREANQLAHEETAKILWEALEFRQERGDWFVHLILLMPDHVHALISFPPDRDMRKVIANWKEVTAKKTRIRWQRDFFDHRLRGDEGYDEQAHYIRLNPVRKKLCLRPEDWLFVWEPINGGPSGPALP